MALEEIIGVPLDTEVLSASWGTVTLNVEWLVRMTSPLEDSTDVQYYLPSFNQQAEPTFTIGLSHYPGRPDLLLKEANSVKEDQNAGRPYWRVAVTYETGQWLRDLFPGEDRGRGTRGSADKIRETGTGGTPEEKEVIVYPWDEPVVWSADTRTVTTTKFHNADGTVILHANGLPITEGIEIPLELEVHTFTWNENYVGFNYDEDVKPYIGKINTTAMQEFKNAAIKHVMCERISVVENRRPVNIGTPAGQSAAGTNAEHHFITFTAVFVIDRSTGTEGYFRDAYRRVSKHTLERSGTFAVPGGLVPIKINEKGDVAQEPWPLLSALACVQLDKAVGSAVPFNLLQDLNPLTDFAFIDPQLPEAVNLEQFRAKYGLEIP